MNIQKAITVAVLFAGSLGTKAQNNPIFNGGSSDGWDKKAFQQASNTIYVGGTADGWSVASYLQAANDIFKGGSSDGWASAAFAQTGNNIHNGGVGDGWSADNYLQAGNSIFVGGIGDGWSSANHLQPGNSIFVGGQGDGWSQLNYLQPGNSIFNGGEGDGWASTYRPLGALPVVFISFTAEKQAATALLKWQTSREENTDRFDVERSVDAIHFEKIGSIAAMGNSSITTFYNFVDRQPFSGYNYYRLKQLDKNGNFIYTPTRNVLFDAASLQKLKAFPVPTTRLLMLEIPSTLSGEITTINLSNAAGIMVQQIKLPQGRLSNREVLNLEALPAGIYTLQVVSKSFNGSQLIIKQ